MSIWITLLIVTLGIAGIIALVHFTGGSARLRLESKAEVLALWDNEFPDHPALGALLEPSGFAALIDLENNGTGLLWAMGDEAVGRVLKAGTLEQRGDILRITLPDMTAPHVDVAISDKMVRRIWAETLKTVLEERA
jgi:hypothetical protein